MSLTRGAAGQTQSAKLVFLLQSLVAVLTLHLPPTLLEARNCDRIFSWETDCRQCCYRHRSCVEEPLKIHGPKLRRTRTDKSAKPVFPLQSLEAVLTFHLTPIAVLGWWHSMDTGLSERKATDSPSPSLGAPSLSFQTSGNHLGNRKGKPLS